MNNQQKKEKGIKKRKTRYLSSKWLLALVGMIGLAIIFGFFSYYKYDRESTNKDKNININTNISTGESSTKNNNPLPLIKTKKDKHATKKSLVKTPNIAIPNNSYKHNNNDNDNDNKTRKNITPKTTTIKYNTNTISADSIVLRQQIQDKQKKTLKAFLNLTTKISSGKIFINELNEMYKNTNNPKARELLNSIKSTAKIGVLNNTKILLELKNISPKIFLEHAKLTRKDKSLSAFKRFTNSLFYIKPKRKSRSKIDSLLSKLENQLVENNLTEAADSIDEIYKNVKLKKLINLKTEITNKIKVMKTVNKVKEILF